LEKDKYVSQKGQYATLHLANHTRSTPVCTLRLTGWSLTIKEIKMTLVQKPINGKEYYADDKVYYTFHQVKVATDTLWSFACMDLGITKKNGFTSQETKDITDLAGIGPRHPTKFLLLKNGDAIPVPYLANGSANLRPNDIILRSAVSPDVPKPTIPPVTTAVSPSASTKSVADRLKEIEDLHNMNLLTDPEYQDKRTKIIEEL
jgi:hypothetical protein